MISYTMWHLKIVYVLNILVAGSIAVSCLRDPGRAAVTVFQQAYPASEVMRLVGCLWLGIAVLSVLGLFRPVTFAPVLLLQLLYKGTWLLVVLLPAVRAGVAYPRGMAIFFVVWVLALPFVIPWRSWWMGG